MKKYSLNEQIAFLRHQKGITQEVLAKHLGVTNQTVSKWESAQCCPDLQMIPLIADYFDVSVDELMGHTVNKSLESICLMIKEYFSDIPEGESLNKVFCLAALLHEIAVSDGYKKFLPWNEKNYAEENQGRWGLSVLNDPSGVSFRNEELILFGLNKEYKRPKVSEIREIKASLNVLSDKNVLKVLYAIQDLTIQDFDIFVSVDEIAAGAKMSADDVEKILDNLPMTINDEGKYRIDGSMGYLPMY